MRSMRKDESKLKLQKKKSVTDVGNPSNRSGLKKNKSSSNVNLVSANAMSKKSLAVYQQDPGVPVQIV